MGSVMSLAAMWNTTMVMAIQGSRWTARLRTTTDTGRPPPGMSPENSATGSTRSIARSGPGEKR